MKGDHLKNIVLKIENLREKAQGLQLLVEAQVYILHGVLVFFPDRTFRYRFFLPQMLGGSKIPLVGTLNLCLKMPTPMEIKSSKSDHSALRK